MREKGEIAQLLIAQYKEHEDEEAVLESKENSRRNRHPRRNESEMEALQQCNEELRVLLTEETKKYERMLRDRNASASNLTEADKESSSLLEIEPYSS